MSLDCVDYGLEKREGVLASTCGLFTDTDTAFVRIGRFVTRYGLPACLNWYHGTGSVFREHVSDMLTFDALIYNCDRHFGNFGVPRDNRTGVSLRPAPLFDHGFSLFNFATADDITRPEEFAGT